MLPGLSKMRSKQIWLHKNETRVYYVILSVQALDSKKNFISAGRLTNEPQNKG